MAIGTDIHLLYDLRFTIIKAGTLHLIITRLFIIKIFIIVLKNSSFTSLVSACTGFVVIVFKKKRITIPDMVVSVNDSS